MLDELIVPLSRNSSGNDKWMKGVILEENGVVYKKEDMPECIYYTDMRNWGNCVKKKGLGAVQRDEEFPEYFKFQKRELLPRGQVVQQDRSRPQCGHH